MLTYEHNEKNRKGTITMSENLANTPQKEGKPDRYIEGAGKKLADQIPWRKTHDDLYDETGALTTDGRIAEAAVNRVTNPQFREEHENGLLNALNANRVADVNVAREAADAERHYREDAALEDRAADMYGSDSTEDGFSKRGAYHKKQKEASQSISNWQRRIRKLAGVVMPEDKVLFSDVTDREAIQYRRDEAHKLRKAASEASDKVVRASDPYYKTHEYDAG